MSELSRQADKGRGRQRSKPSGPSPNGQHDKRLVIAPKPEFKIEFMTSKQFDEREFVVDYAIDDVEPAKQPGIIGAPSKSLKTVLAAAGFMAKASGDDFLGKFPVERAIRCALISAESGFASLRKTARAIAAANDRRLADYENLIWSEQILNLESSAHLKALRSLIKGEGLESIGLDPVYLMFPGLGDKATSIFEMGARLVELSRIVADCGCGLTLIHHFRGLNGDPYQEPELGWLSHAGFAQWARWWWLLNRRSKYDPENRGFHELWLHLGGSAGHSAAYAIDVDEGLQPSHAWNVTFRYASEARGSRARAAHAAREQEKAAAREATITNNRAAIMKAFKRYPDGETANVLRAEAGMSGDSFKPAVMDLIDDGLVETFEIVKNGCRREGYRPIRTQPDSAGQSGPSGSGTAHNRTTPPL
jgi:hypothetical protein